MKNKAIVLTSAALLLAAGATLAAPCPRGGPPGADLAQLVDRRVQAMTTYLDLSTEQQGQVRTILEQQIGSGQRGAAHDAIKAVLTDEQAAELEQLRAQRQAQRGPRW